jgi:hypothetical protein
MAPRLRSSSTSGALRLFARLRHLHRRSLLHHAYELTAPSAWVLEDSDKLVLAVKVPSNATRLVRTTDSRRLDSKTRHKFPKLHVALSHTISRGEWHASCSIFGHRSCTFLSLHCVPDRIRCALADAAVSPRFRHQACRPMFLMRYSVSLSQKASVDSSKMRCTHPCVRSLWRSLAGPSGEGSRHLSGLSSISCFAP